MAFDHCAKDDKHGRVVGSQEDIVLHQLCTKIAAILAWEMPCTKEGRNSTSRVKNGEVICAVRDKMTNIARIEMGLIKQGCIRLQSCLRDRLIVWPEPKQSHCFLKLDHRHGLSRLHVYKGVTRQSISA